MTLVSFPKHYLTNYSLYSSYTVSQFSAMEFITYLWHTSHLLLNHVGIKNDIVCPVYVKCFTINNQLSHFR